ncbi:MAG: hypothetical protein WCO03_01645 [bacterium]
MSKERPVRLLGKTVEVEKGGFFVSTSWKGSEVLVFLTYYDGRRLMMCNGHEDGDRYRYSFRRRSRIPKEIRINPGREIYFQVLRQDMGNHHIPRGKLWGVPKYKSDEVEAIRLRHKREARKNSRDHRYNNEALRRR